MIIRISGSEFRTKQEVCNEIRSNKSYLIDKLGRYVERERGRKAGETFLISQRIAFSLSSPTGRRTPSELGKMENKNGERSRRLNGKLFPSDS